MINSIITMCFYVAAATLMQLQDETLAFERTEFSVAVKKAIVDALD